MLVNILPLLPDEMLYSWLYRLSIANGIAFKRFVQEFTGRYNYMTLEVGCFVPGLLYNIGYKADSIDFFMESSVFPYYSLSMNRAYQAKYVAGFFTSSFNILGKNEPLINVFRVCPECLKEDIERYGQPYLHRAHHIDGVKVCHIHGSLLRETRFRTADSFSFDIGRYTPIAGPVNCDREKEYACFGSRMLGLRIEVDINDIKDILKNRCLEKELFASRKEQWSSLEPEKFVYGCYFDKDTRINLKKIASGRSVPMRFLEGLIMYLYCGSFETFKNELMIYTSNRKVPENNTIKLAGKPAGLLHAYRHEDCGYCFVQTEWGAKAFGCPYCNSEKYSFELIKEIAERCSNNEYRVEGNPKDINDKIWIRHKACGDVCIRPAKNFIFDGVRCRCEYKVCFEEVAKRISDCGPYELVEYNGTESKAVIRHKECGGTFPIMLHKFIASPYCRLCDKVHMTEEDFRERVAELTDDEFDVVSEYRGAGERIDIRHKKCGKTHSYLPYLFLKNCRCAECAKNISFDRVKKLLEKGTSGHYTMERYSHNSSCYLVDTVTGNKIKTQVSVIYFELLSDTRSSMIVLTDIEENTRIGMLEELRKAPRLLLEEFYGYIKEVFGKRDYFRTSEIEFNGMNKNNIKAMLYRLKKQGLLHSEGFGKYSVTKE